MAVDTATQVDTAIVVEDMAGVRTATVVVPIAAPHTSEVADMPGAGMATVVADIQASHTQEAVDMGAAHTPAVRLGAVVGTVEPVQAADTPLAVAGLVGTPVLGAEADTARVVSLADMAGLVLLADIRPAAVPLAVAWVVILAAAPDTFRASVEVTPGAAVVMVGAVAGMVGGEAGTGGVATGVGIVPWRGALVGGD